MKISKKKNKQVHFDFTETQLMKILTSAERDGSVKTLIMLLAYLMEEEGMTQDKLIDVFETASRWTAAEHDRTIKLKQVTDIINERTGIGITVGGYWTSIKDSAELKKLVMGVLHCE